MCDSIWASQNDKAIMYGVLDSVQEINQTLEKIKMPEKKIFIDFDQYSVRFSVCRENDYSVLCEPTNSYDVSLSVEAIKNFICKQ